jgi:putative two-component system response regulator
VTRIPSDVVTPRGWSRSAREPDAHLLLVDGSPQALALLSDILELAGYRQRRSAIDVFEACRICAEGWPDLIVFDSHKALDAGASLQQLRAAALPEHTVPILMLSGDISPEARERAFRSGAGDLLLKPFSPPELLLRVQNLLEARRGAGELEEGGRRQPYGAASPGPQAAETLERVREIELEQLAHTAALHDGLTHAHSQRVGWLAARVAAALLLPDEEVDLIRRAACFHDIGKIRVPDSILLKPGPLTVEEFTLIKTHPQAGAMLLASPITPLVHRAREVALYHHERWDGNGYPFGLSGEWIPLAARIVAVADVFDALTGERPYKPAWPPEEAIAEICSQGGRHFDPRVVRAFREGMERTWRR